MHKEESRVNSMKSQVELSTRPLNTPKHPEFSTAEARVNSFRGQWPIDKRPTPEALSIAGLYCTGCGDDTKCFYCDGGLRNWEDTDDPWIEHAKWFPRCNFIKEQKGQPFILQVLCDFENEDNQPCCVRDPAIGQTMVDPREIQARMNLPVIQNLLSIGHRPEIIERALHTRLATYGEDFPSVESLLDAIKLEDFNTVEIGPFEPDRSNYSLVQPTTSTQNVPFQEPHINRSASLSSSSTLSAEDLRRENEALREQVTCKVCLERDVNTVFLPCGHLVCCDACAAPLQLCPICRGPIRGTIRTFLA